MVSTDYIVCNSSMMDVMFKDDINTVLGSNEKVNGMFDRGKFDGMMYINNGDTDSRYLASKEIKCPESILDLVKSVVPLMKGVLIKGICIYQDDTVGGLSLSVYTHRGVSRAFFSVSSNGLVMLRSSDKEFHSDRDTLGVKIEKVLKFFSDRVLFPVTGIEYWFVNDLKGNKVHASSQYFYGVSEVSTANGFYALCQGLGVNRVEGEYVFAVLDMMK